MEFSPLFWPVELKGEAISVLDETRLPQRLVYLKIKNYQEACQAIKSMKTRAIGQVLLVFYTFLLHVRRIKEEKKLENPPACPGAGWGRPCWIGQKEPGGDARPTGRETEGGESDGRGRLS